MVKLVIALVLLGHGIGHSMGPLKVFNLATVNPAWHGDSWLLTGLAGSTITQWFGVAVWVASLVGFTALAFVVVGWLPEAWWVPLAVGSSVTSLLGILLFPVAFPTFSTIGAIAVDTAVLAAVLWLHWSPSDLTA
jgi:hypothetical protein